VAVALGVEDAALAGAGIDALDRAALVVRRRPHPHEVAGQVEAAAVVAEVERAVGPEGESVRAARGEAEPGDGAVGADARDAAAVDLGEDDGAVAGDDGPLGKAQPSGEDADFGGHAFLPLRFGARDRSVGGPGGACSEPRHRCRRAAMARRRLEGRRGAR
jgi:hypothetical protein